MVATLVSPLAQHQRRAVPRPHGRAPADRRPRRAAARARPDRARCCSRSCRAAGWRWLRVLAHPVVALTAVGGRLLRLAPAGALPGRGRATTPCTRSSTCCSWRCGMAMWMALLGPLPKPAWFGNGAKIGYIIAVRLIESVLANVAAVVGRPCSIPATRRGERLWHVSPLADQSTAGAIMMVEGSIVTICLFGWLFWRAARESEERQALVELAAARGVELRRSGPPARWPPAAATRCASASSRVSSRPARSAAPSRPRCPRRARPARRGGELAGAQVRAQRLDRRRAASTTSPTAGASAAAQGLGVAGGAAGRWPAPP